MSSAASFAGPQPGAAAAVDIGAALAGISDARRAAFIAAFNAVRAETERRAAPLSPEDQVIQSMPDASPIKWHRAHTSWFFEQFLLVPHAEAYRVFDERLAFLFNSYYVSAGPRHARPKRGLVTRPDAAEVTAYRRHVDAAVRDLIERAEDAALEKVLAIVEIGLHHEQQHQELMLTDILHAFAQNPLLPAYDPAWRPPLLVAGTTDFVQLDEGIHAIGHDGGGFRFDNEMPVHRQLVGPVRIARHLVSNGEWLQFIADGGYATPTLWLSDGWATVEAEGWVAPGHWRMTDGHWVAFMLGGPRRIDPAAPVCHIRYYEADACFSRRAPAEEERADG